MEKKRRLIPLVFFFVMLFLICGCSDKINETKEESTGKETLVETREEAKSTTEKEGKGEGEEFPQNTSSVSSSQNIPGSSTSVTSSKSSGSESPVTSTEKGETPPVSTTKKASVSTSQTKPPKTTTKWPFGGGIELPEDEF